MNKNLMMHVFYICWGGGKNCTLCFHDNFLWRHSVLIIFGILINNWTCNKMSAKLLTSPNRCFYTVCHSYQNWKLFDKLTNCQNVVKHFVWKLLENVCIFIQDEWNWSWFSFQSIQCLFRSNEVSAGTYFCYWYCLIFLE